jgi:hypothetical protein
MKSTRFPAALSWLLALSLLLTSVWGQWHRVAHEIRLHAALVAAPSEIGHDHSGHEPGSDLCRVLDHLAYADGLKCVPPVLVLPALARVAPDALAASQVTASAYRYFQARAPPFSV